MGLTIHYGLRADALSSWGFRSASRPPQRPWQTVTSGRREAQADSKRNVADGQGLWNGGKIPSFGRHVILWLVAKINAWLLQGHIQNRTRD
jgi:hypothetical protein